jgi:hypothetical protein
MQLLQSHPGRVIAGLGGVFAIYAFLCMPWVSLGFLGSYTAVQVAQFAIQQLHTPSLPSLWPALFVAGAVVILSALGCFTLETEPGLPIALMILGTIALLGIMGIYVYLSQQWFFTVPLTALLSTGFWFYAFSMLLVLSGGFLQLRLLRRKPPIAQHLNSVHTISGQANNMSRK